MTMPGYLSDEGLLHAVETRTPNPVCVFRDIESLQTITIVSAAVDSMAVAEAQRGLGYEREENAETMWRTRFFNESESIPKECLHEIPHRKSSPMVMLAGTQYSTMACV
jgi:hypothetical protein